MAQCSYCNATTELYDYGTPICLQCSETREAKRKAPAMSRTVRRVLERELETATFHTQNVLAEFAAVMARLPHGASHSEGIQRIHSVSRELSLARKEMIKAHDRLNDFLVHGIVPDDLKAAASA